MNSTIWPLLTWAGVIGVLAVLGLVTPAPWRDLFWLLAKSMSAVLVLALTVAGLLLVVTL
ncbi:hypothetical protein [Nocardia flavorosea]|uniref:Uncharacterized protein n=1 Tax=Nocardia flavorosea TaxID=53429 RepID=A0A846YTF7_9NOCA|nr:hypothetical protein [Nocardia flavorosea]NKY60778.1 hypothetical protein [Nocardia flavorosea]